MKRLAMLCCGLIALMVVNAEAANHELPAHEIIAHEAINVIPTDIRPLFAKNIETLDKHVLEPATEWPRDRKLRDRNRWHDVIVDISAENPNQQSRMEAFQAFPRTRKEARRLLSKAGSRGAGGQLPWAVEQCFEELVSAFRGGDPADILAWTGYLAHFVGDASNPLRNSQQNRLNPIFGANRSAHNRDTDATLRERFFVSLPSIKGGSYALEIELNTTDYTPLADPIDATFDLIRKSLLTVDDIAAADADIMTALGSPDRSEFKQLRSQYYVELDRRCGDTCVNQMSEGARVLAGLIGGAWELAGSPTIDTLRNRAVPDAMADDAPASSGRFMGSRHSKVFHIEGCPFGKQIADDNLVYFESATAARRDGRRACKRCEPK